MAVKQTEPRLFILLQVKTTLLLLHEKTRKFIFIKFYYNRNKICISVQNASENWSSGNTIFPNSIQFSNTII